MGARWPFASIIFLMIFHDFPCFGSAWLASSSLYRSSERAASQIQMCFLSSNANRESSWEKSERKEEKEFTREKKERERERDKQSDNRRERGN